MQNANQSGGSGACGTECILVTEAKRSRRCDGGWIEEIFDYNALKDYTEYGCDKRLVGNQIPCEVHVVVLGTGQLEACFH